MSDEEEVVFEGSPLALHLKDAKVEFEAVSREDKFLGRQHQDAGETSNGDKKIFESSGTFVDIYYKKKCLELLIASNLLIEEDKLLLIEFMREVEAVPISTNIKPTLKRGLLDALMIGFMVSPLRTLSPRAHMGVSFFIPLAIGWRWRTVFTAPAQLKRLKCLIEFAKRIDDCVKRALRQIGEISLINRGYLLLDRTSTACRLEKPNLMELSRRSQANLPGLRKALLFVCKRLSCYLADATNDLKRRKALPYDLDHRDLYLPPFEVDLSFESHNEDNIPTVEKLRLEANKHILVRSEYLRRLFLHILLADSTPMNIIWSSALEDQMKCCLEVILDALNMYKPYVSTLTKPREITPGRPRSRLEELANCCHSTSVHVQEALFTSQKCEKLIYNCKTFSALDIAKVDELSRKIKYHMQCADLCIERSAIFSGKEIKKTSAPVEVIAQPPTNNEQERVITADERVDIAQYDEVFELYSKGEVEKSLVEEEEETCKSVNSGQLMVLHELKNVLAVKAADWKEREKAARRQLIGDSHEDGSMGSESEDDVDKVSSSKSKVERKKSAEESERVVSFTEAPSQTANVALPVQPFEGLGTAMVGSLAAEAVAKARFQHSLGLMSKTQSFGESDSESSD